MSTTVRAIRGATTLDRDEVEHLTDRVQELTRKVLADNHLDHDAVISIIFTATSDISSKFPATAARELGLDDVPLLGAQELTVDDMTPLCIRAMFHVTTERPRSEIRHVYLHGARAVRADLAE